MMIRNIKILFLVLAVTLMGSCELDLLDNPNAVTVNNADINYILNSVELGARNNFGDFSGLGGAFTRMFHLGGAAIYDNSSSPAGSDGRWNTAYAGVLADVNALIPLAEKGELFVHAGIGRVVRAMVLMNLVDYFGDVPYSQALDPSNFNPGVDKGADVYAAALADLNKAIENFNAKSKGGATTDLFYGGSTDNWIRAANTLKLKLNLNLRLINKAGATSAINALITDNKLISTAAQNFVFKYGTNLTNPDTRHPSYAGQYSPTGGGDYQSNSYMGTLHNAKGFPDPRIRFYFYRQTIKNSTDVNEIRCINNSKPAHYSENDVFCYATSVGYWGRDHLSNEGIPPDGLKRTAYGVYPSGGLYDNDAGVGVSLGAGAGGAGIRPIMMRSFVDFMLAEAALTLGTSGNPRDLLKSAIEKSMADVRSLAMGSSEAGKITAFESSKGFVWADEVKKYVDKVLADYDAAASDDARLNIIATEYWIALYGNGIEAYNLYRRTGKPANQQPGLDPNVGPFPRSIYYPNSYIARNKNAVQKSNMSVQVFWDNNPANNFIK
ncbi:MAG: SusD/RagB family nutrient-binding outer membrane lipoprotein [Haliscomenobacter sp.]|uniref:SusD/RagB family nutrient-binding outer membrane lipoprotein n=1 Tax=Haliscomenobacter sp. TaxID=2717303 RepID=UPI0029AC568D|nr:SusD/RagB family nutrient-binding outer membrane lipoprotein [Haliscomenobacter sp.]MDX2069105.1 SusD/RagB family nutrient-binding outer membrane lipoprotein [Haliscomenobacter sp.]